MNKSGRLTIITLLLTFSTLASSNYKSVQWQRFELESFLKERVSKISGQLIEKEKFFVEVAVSADDPSIAIPKYNFLKLKKTKLKQDKGPLKGDYILFDKLGLNAPTYQGNNDQRKGELDLLLFQYSKKVEREYFSKMDIFSNIKSIEVKIGVDKSVAQETIDSLKDIVENTLPVFGEIKPKITVFNLAFKLNKTPSFLKKNSDVLAPIGIILAALIFSLSGLILFSRYRKLREELSQNETSAIKEEKETQEESLLPNTEQVIDPNFRPGSAQLTEAIGNTESGIDRFCLYLEKSTDQAINLVKKWITISSKQSEATLFILSESLSVDELYKIFVKLNANERQKFKSLMSEYFSVSNKTQADKYLAQQVLEDIMSVNMIEDKELQKLLLEISPLNAARLANEHIEEGAQLINLVGSDFLGKMFIHLDADKSDAIYEKALSLKEDDLKNDFTTLKNKLENYVVTVYRNPFERSVVEVMHELDYISSEKLLDVLISKKQFEIIEDIIKASFPVRLIELLPDVVFKGVFKTMNTKSKVEVILSFQESKRVNFLDKVAKSGTKGRELLDFEIKQSLNNAEFMENIEENKQSIYGGFIETIRQNIKTDEDIQVIAYKLARTWLEDIRGQNLSELNNAA
jgi:hypothetical protein